jgi:anhydro-N-acetylmuramic acid kinase
LSAEPAAPAASNDRARPGAPLAPDPALVIGLISGTSADGVDAALCRIASRGAPDRTPAVAVDVLSFATTPYEPALRIRVLRAPELRTPELAALHVELGERFARAALDLARDARVAIDDVDLVSSHGQTVWHDPRGERAGRPATLQLAEPAVLAARTGRLVVADFRPMDVALGGEGAPLVPYADFLLLRRPGRPRAVLNLGGIANVTWLPAADGPQGVVAFDTGPGNALLDALVRRFELAPEGHDPGGRIALAGRASAELLEELLAEPFFSLPPPRSTGPELFGEALARRVAGRAARLGLTPPDLLATAAALTGRSAAEAILRWAGTPAEVLLCGGGRHNLAVRRELAAALAPVPLRDTDDEGLGGDAREAVAFALLGWLAARGLANHLPRTTGASRPAILGKLLRGAPA